MSHSSAGSLRPTTQRAARGARATRASENGRTFCAILLSATSTASKSAPKCVRRSLSVTPSGCSCRKASRRSSIPSRAAAIRVAEVERRRRFVRHSAAMGKPKGGSSAGGGGSAPSGGGGGGGGAAGGGGKGGAAEPKTLAALGGKTAAAAPPVEEKVRRARGGEAPFSLRPREYFTDGKHASSRLCVRGLVASRRRSARSSSPTAPAPWS